MNSFKQLHWPLITGMGALALIHPFVNITGMMDGLGRPAGPVLVLMLISVIWLAIAVFANLRQPFLTLVFAGLTYGLFAIAISAVLSPIVTGELTGPSTHPIAIAAVLITNAMWGMTIGLISWGIRRFIKPSQP